jgi:class 3 adenylate cyclase
VSRREGGRRFATILFTDIVGSTDIARELGDARWRELVRRHHATVRRELKRFDGHEMDTAGDSFFAIFDSPGAAIRCAVSICDAVREVGLEVRAGLHGGEIEPSEGKAGGIAVNIGARVMAVAGFGEVLVSSTLRDVVAGSALVFDDHGLHTLKGIEGEWRLYRVASVDGERVAEPLDGGEASRRRLAIEPVSALAARPRWLVPAAVAVVMLVGVLAFALTRDRTEPLDGPGGPLPNAGPPASSIAKLDPTSGDVVFVRTDVPGRSYGESRVLFGSGSVWLIRPPLVSKVDPQDGSNTIVGGLEGSEVDRIGVGLGKAWALGAKVWPIDAATGQAGVPLEYAPPRAAFFNGADVEGGFGSVWISVTDGEVIRIDPGDGTMSSIDVGETPGDIAIGSRYVWVLDSSAGSVSRIDPSTNRVLRPIHLTGRQDALAIGEGFVWVLDSSIGTLTPIDEETGEVREQRVDVGADASSVAAGETSVWVARGGDVLEISPASFSVTRTIHVGDNAIGTLAVDDAGAIWLDMVRAG